MKFKTLIKRKEDGTIEFYGFYEEELVLLTYPKLFNPDITKDDLEKYMKLMFHVPVDISQVELVEITLSL